MLSFTISYPSSVGTGWQFSVAIVGGEVVITGTLKPVPTSTFELLGF